MWSDGAKREPALCLKTYPIIHLLCQEPLQFTVIKLREGLYFCTYDPCLGIILLLTGSVAHQDYMQQTKSLNLLWLESSSSLPSGDLWISVLVPPVPVCSDKEAFTGKV